MSNNWERIVNIVSTDLRRRIKGGGGGRIFITMFAHNLQRSSRLPGKVPIIILIINYIFHSITKTLSDYIFIIEMKQVPEEQNTSLPLLLVIIKNGITINCAAAYVSFGRHDLVNIMSTHAHTEGEGLEQL